MGAFKGFISDARISSYRVDSLTRYDMPLALKYEVEMEPFEEDIVYLNPMFSEGIQKNPFEAAQRRYPVELPFTMDQTYTLTMEVPEGYVVDELPKQIIAKMDEAGSGYFEYRISQSGNTISLRTIIRFGKTVFHPDEYENLRSFFNLIVSRHSGQIVFKKKK